MDEERPVHWDELEYYFERQRLFEDEVFSIKARQRHYQQHDPWCDKIEDELLEENGWPVHHMIRVCNCWLFLEESE